MKGSHPRLGRHGPAIEGSYYPSLEFRLKRRKSRGRRSRQLRMPSTIRGLRHNRGVIAWCAIIVISLSGSCAHSPHPRSSSSGKPRVVKITMTAMPRGTAVLHRDPNTGIFSVKVDVFGLTPRSSHQVTLRSGPCGSATGPNQVTFPDLKADPHGAFKGEFLAGARSPELRGPVHLDMQLGSTKLATTSPGSSLLACARFDASQLGAVAPWKSSTAPNRPTAVTISYEASGVVQVHVLASGFVPSTKHAMHIHFGSCSQQSGVIYSVGDIHADVHGDIIKTITLTGTKTPLPAASLYVDIHTAPTDRLVSGSEAALGFQPLQCGNA